MIKKKSSKRHRESARRWQKENPERHRANAKLWQQQNLDRCRKASMRWREKHPEKSRISAKRYRENNPEKITNARRKRIHGISPDAFRNFLETQKYSCAICEKKFTKARLPHIDHDHSSGKIRGLLCSPCNLGLGQFKDSKLILRRAANYL